MSSESLAIAYQSAKHYVPEGSNHHVAQGCQLKLTGVPHNS